jgi:hypothetical protein
MAAPFPLIELLIAIGAAGPDTIQFRARVTKSVKYSQGNDDDGKNRDRRG